MRQHCLFFFNSNFNGTLRITCTLDYVHNILFVHNVT